MLIFFDFDGTLSDMSERWWRLHVDIIQKYGGRPVLKKEYFKNKRNAISEREIIKNHLKNDFIQKYIDQRIKWIEKNKYLEYDHLIPHAPAILQAWSQKGNLILLTKRNSKHNFFRQVKNYDIKKYFSRLLITEGLEKEEILKKEYTHAQLKNAYLITDSLEETKMGKKLGMNVLTIAYGTRSPEYFQKNGISDMILKPFDLKMAASYVSQS